MPSPDSYPTFLGIEAPHFEYAPAFAAVLPVPFEATTTYGKGTRLGPRAIFDASLQVELYDEELGAETYRRGIASLPAVEFGSGPIGEELRRIGEAARPVLADGKFLVSLGGEHSVTAPLVEACASVHGPLTVLQLDAHADLRDTYENSPHSHACVMRRVTERHQAVQVGIRNLSAEEARLIEGGGYRVFFAHEMIADAGWMERALAALGDPVYLTIDLDFFDPSMMPGVGTPEPGGLGWYETLRFLRRVASERRILAMDVVELCPIPGQRVSEFAAAKLVYRLLGYVGGAARGKSGLRGRGKSVY
jgi:agmatinase